MRRVLFIAYYFPPIGGAGAQRPARMVRHLPSLGWEPVVVTGPGPAANRWTPRDDSLAAEVPAEVEVVRVPGPEPVPGGRAERWLGVRGAWERWWVDGAVEAGRHAGDVDLVYTWMSPFESARAASRIAKELGVPWVADLGDPWALDEMMVYPTELHRRRELARMERALADADAVVMSTPEAAKRVRARLPRLRDRRVVSIANGFDGDDFAAAVEPRGDDAFRIVHTGYLHTSLGLRHRRASRARRALGGFVRDVDFLPRSHVYLLEAVERLAASQPELAERIEVHLAGALTDDDRAVVNGSPRVRMHGYLQHAETLRLLRTADLLFLPMQDLASGARASIVPGKTYEYLAAGPPVLAAVPRGDAADLLAEAGHARIVSPKDVTGMERAIAREVRRARGGHPVTPARPDLVARYEYRRLTEQLAGVFADVLRPVTVPVAADARRPVAATT